MKDAFGVHKAHHHHYTFKRLVKELTSQGASTTYDQSKRKRRVSKGMRLKDGARIRFRTKTHKSGAVDIEARGAKKRIDDGGSPTTGIGYLLLRPNKTVSMVHTDEAFRRQKVATRLREHAESKFGPIEDSEFRRPMGEAWSQAYAKSHGGRTLPPNKLEVSKIALQPVYHGTSATGATKLLRYIKSHEPSKSSFKFVTGKPRADGSPGNPSDPRPEGLYTTQYKYKADDYALTGRSPSHGGIEQRTKRGKTLMFNAVGAKPKYRGDGEAIYDPKDLGAPLATHDIKRTRMMRPRFNETVANIEQHDKAMVAARAKGEHLGDPWSPQKTSAETRADRRKAIFGNAMPRTADFGTQY